MATMETLSGERTDSEQASADGLVEKLRAIVGAKYVITHPDQLRTYESDGLLHHKGTPTAVVLPDTAEQVQGVVRACWEAKVPWVARGAGSGLSGGALPVEDGILIACGRMRRVLEVDLPNQRVVVEPAVTNVEITKVVRPTHYFPPDPSSQIVCTIGGNVAENSGGAHCFKYGFTTNYVTGLEIVLSDGTIVNLGGKHVDSPGYDLVGPFVGSEGTLGVVTKVTVRVIPSAEAVKTLVAFYDSIDEAGQTVSDIVSSGVVPGAIEMMDHLSVKAAEEATHVGYPTDAEAALTVELDGSQEECDARFDEVVEVCRRNGAREVRVAKDEAERALIWKARKSAFGAMGRLSPNYFVQDGVIPRTRLSEALTRIAKLSEDYGLGVANVFHAGDGNLHPLIAYDGSVAGEADRAEELSGEIIKVCLELGGSITGEHGVGIDKKRYMTSQFSEGDLEAFQRLRCSFDPAGLANPGKLMPTPRLCGEVPGPYRQHPLEAAGLAERF
jgi:glycolate oxidase